MACAGYAPWLLLAPDPVSINQGSASVSAWTRPLTSVSEPLSDMAVAIFCQGWPPGPSSSQAGPSSRARVASSVVIIMTDGQWANVRLGV